MPATAEQAEQVAEHPRYYPMLQSSQTAADIQVANIKFVKQVRMLAYLIFFLMAIFIGFVGFALNQMQQQISSNNKVPTQRIFGPRVPRSFFFTTGSGLSNVGIETGSFDAALFNASIADMNVMKYTSVLPRESRKIERKNASLHHGAVLECIMAQSNGESYDLLTAGILTVRLRRRKDQLEIGGYVVEYPSSDAGVPGVIDSGINVTREDALNNLKEAMDGLLTRRYGTNYKEMYELYDDWNYVKSMRVGAEYKYGSVIVALGFTDWIYPENAENRVDYRVKYGRFVGDL